VLLLSAFERTAGRMVRGGVWCRWCEGEWLYFLVEDWGLGFGESEKVDLLFTMAVVSDDGTEVGIRRAEFGILLHC